MNVHTAIIPDKRRQLKGGNYPLRLRITYKAKRHYYSLNHERRQGVNFNVTPDEWERVNHDSPRGRLRDIKMLIPGILEEADNIIKDIRPFSFYSFDLAYNGTGKAKNLFGLFESYISELKKEGRVSTAESYRCTLNSLKLYDDKVNFDDITPVFLSKYESWMLNRGKSISTAGIYLRTLRAIFNLAIKEKLTAYYPFRDYIIPTGTNPKKALELSDIAKIINYETIPGSQEDRAKDIWLFSYFSNGMNVKDICNLQLKNIDLLNNEISYIRQKTKRSRRQKKITVDIIPETLQIIKKWGDLTGNPDDYLFNFFWKDITPEKQRKVTQNLIKQTNKHFNIIRQNAGIMFVVNTYHARHSFANVLKQSGAPIELISEMLGHSDLTITESYLKSFSAEYRKRWRDKLKPETVSDLQRSTN